MKWNKYTLHTTSEAVDFISAAFAEIGIEGIEIEDSIPLDESETRGMFIDILPEALPDTGKASISFYLEEEDEEIIRSVKEALKEVAEYCDIGEARLTREETEDRDWLNNWKEFFKPFLIEDILIKPTWEEIPKEAEYKTMVQIDPGTAFGTGGHETTKLCIRGLRKYISEFTDRHPLTVLDIGTGSGILGISAIKLGADYVFAADLDENVFESVRENMKANGVSSEQMNIACGDILKDGAMRENALHCLYDIVVANILAPVIIEIQKQVAEFLKPGGVFIASGIIDTKEEEVRRAISENPDLEIIEIRKDGEWVSIAARKAKNNTPCPY